MSKKQQGTYRLAGGITVTDADLEADAQRFEAGECDGAWKVVPKCPKVARTCTTRSMTGRGGEGQKCGSGAVS